MTAGCSSCLDHKLHLILGQKSLFTCHGINKEKRFYFFQNRSIVLQRAVKKNNSVPPEAVEGIKRVRASAEQRSGIDFHFKFPYQLVAIVYRSIGSKGGIFSRVISVPPLCVYKTEYTTKTVSDSDASCIS